MVSPSPRTTRTALSYLLRSLSTDEILKIPRTTAVLETILDRSDAQDADRLVALIAIAKEKQTSRVAELLCALWCQEPNPTRSRRRPRLAHLLPWQLPEELKAERPRLAETCRHQHFRRVAPDRLGDAGSRGQFLRRGLDRSLKITCRPRRFGQRNSPAERRPDFVEHFAYDRVKPLLGKTSALRKSPACKPRRVTSGRFVAHVELPRQGTLTLAEVQVFSGGTNIARQGKAKQSSTANGGEAARAIDGRTDWHRVRAASTLNSLHRRMKDHPHGGKLIWATNNPLMPSPSGIAPTEASANASKISRSRCWMASAAKFSCKPKMSRPRRASASPCKTI